MEESNRLELSSFYGAAAFGAVWESNPGTLHGGRCEIRTRGAHSRRSILAGSRHKPLAQPSSLNCQRSGAAREIRTRTVLVLNETPPANWARTALVRQERFELSTRRS
jgi:hypothetical protein